MYAAVSGALLENGATSLFTLLDFSAIWKRVLGSFLAAGAAIGAVGTGFAIRKFLQV